MGAQVPTRAVPLVLIDSSAQTTTLIQLLKAYRGRERTKREMRVQVWLAVREKYRVSEVLLDREMQGKPVGLKM